MADTNEEHDCTDCAHDGSDFSVGTVCAYCLDGKYKHGFGLVRWTPKTKATPPADAALADDVRELVAYIDRQFTSAVHYKIRQSEWEKVTAALRARPQAVAVAQVPEGRVVAFIPKVLIHKFRRAIDDQEKRMVGAMCVGRPMVSVEMADLKTLLSAAPSANVKAGG